MVQEALRRVLEADGRIAYALLFGSAARESSHAHSDVDVAVGLASGVELSALELGGLTAALETAARRRVDVAILDEAPPSLAFRVFRDGRVLTARDRDALVARRARAILDYLDWKPFEEMFTRGVLAAATRGR